MTDQASQSLADPAARRALLRREKIAARQAMTASEHASSSRQVLRHLTDWLAARPGGTIAFCMPIRAEVDCRPVILELIAAGWQAAMPVVVLPDAPMEFRRWSPGMPMAADPFGIPVPGGSETVVPDVVLLPLVAFDAAGYRLGYGGGYFDRTLATAMPRPLAVGVGFDLCAVASIFPEAHDVPLDVVITESGIRHFRGRADTP